VDAPPTQYRVIERGGRLIVLDARTNLPPKQAVDLHPGRTEDRTPERVSARELFRGNAATKRRAERTGRSSTAMQKPVTQGGNAGPSTKKVLKIPAVVIGLISAAIIIGGFIGMAIAAGAILYAGYVALNSTKTST